MNTHALQSSHLDEDARKAWKAFFLVSNLLIEQVEQALNQKGVSSLSEYDTLYTLEKGPADGLTIRELTASLTISHSGLSRLLDRLEARQAIVRCTDTVDKRAVRIKLLAKGHEAIDATWEIYSETVQELFGSVLSKEELHQMLHLCTKLAGPLITRKESQARSPFIHRIDL